MPQPRARGPRRKPGSGRRPRVARAQRDSRLPRDYDSDEEEEYDEHAYAVRPAGQNPLVYVGAGGGVLLLIIIIAVAASGGGGGGRRRSSRKKHRSISAREVARLEAKASDLCRQGHVEFQRAQEAEELSGKRAAHGHYGAARQLFEAGKGVYKELARRLHQPDAYKSTIEEINRQLEIIHKEIGMGN